MNLQLILTIVLGLLQLGDWYTTTKGLAAGATEKNPVMKWFMDRIGVQATSISKCIIVTVAGYYLAQVSLYAIGALIDLDRIQRYIVPD